MVGTLGGIVGATLGGIDSKLGGGSFTDGAISGAKWGAGLAVASLVPGLGPVILTLGSFAGGYGIGSSINDGNYAQAAFRIATVAGSFAIAGYQGKPPPGFKDLGSFLTFGARIAAGLKRAGYEDTVAKLGGSAASGKSAKTGKPFSDSSDYDIALVGEDVFQAALRAGVKLRAGGERTRPLNAADLRKMGLNDLAAELSTIANREVNFMVFKNLAAAGERGNSVLLGP